MWALEMWILGIKLRSLMHTKQALYQLSYFPRPSLIIGYNHIPGILDMLCRAVMSDALKAPLYLLMHFLL